MGRIILVLSVCLSLVFADANTSEYRALWVTRFELSDPANIPFIVQNAAEHNFNALFVQVCGRGTAFYESAILPKDDQAVSYDALAIFITEAKKYNIEVHAWVNALYVWSDSGVPKSPQHVVNLHPDWLISEGKNRYLDPTIPEVRDYVTEVCVELVRKYPVAGIHLDYIRFAGDYGYSPFARADFERQNGVDPLALSNNKAVSVKLYGRDAYDNLWERWQQYRRDAVSLVVHQVYGRMLKQRAAAKLSAAVISDYEKATDANFQDWRAWLEGGYVDMIVPMAYDTNDRVVEQQIVFAAQMAQQYGRMVLIGLGAWRRSPQDIGGSIAFIRSIRDKLGFKQLGGMALFSYDRLSEQKDYLPKLKQEVFTEKVETPQLNYQKKSVAAEDKIKEERLKQLEKGSPIG